MGSTYVRSNGSAALDSLLERERELERLVLPRSTIPFFRAGLKTHRYYMRTVNGSLGSETQIVMSSIVPERPRLIRKKGMRLRAARLEPPWRGSAWRRENAMLRFLNWSTAGYSRETQNVGCSASLCRFTAWPIN